MLIRSQNKRELVDITNTKICIEESRGYSPADYYIFACGAYQATLGKYTSEEKALNVLDMIEAEYNAPIYINKIAYQYEKYDHEVFHMPEDSEVIV